MNCNFAFDPSTKKHIVVYIIVLIHNTLSSHQLTPHFIVIYRCCNLAIPNTVDVLPPPAGTINNVIVCSKFVIEIGLKSEGNKRNSNN